MRTDQILFRLSPQERARVEAIQRQMQAEQPGARITLSDAVRHAIHTASAALAVPVGVKTKPGQQFILDENEPDKGA